jgi:hypothetical protein
MREEARGKTGQPTDRRNKPERPRDELGRPQPWGAPNRLALEPYDDFTLDQNHALGIRSFDERRFFPAHEAWETAWKQAKGTGDEEFFKGLSQLGAGYVHLLRGNAHGAVRLLRRATSRLQAFPVGHRGVDTAAVCAAAERDARAVESGDLRPGEDAPHRAPVIGRG